MELAQVKAAAGIHRLPHEANEFEEKYRQLVELNPIFRLISDASDPLREQFVDLYRDAFSRSPYHEEFPKDFVVEKIWTPLCNHVLVAAEKDGILLGFGSGHKASAREISPSSLKFLQDNNELFIKPERTQLISDLAVHRDCEGIGLGSALAVALLVRANIGNYSHFAVRVGSDDFKTQHIFEKFGAKSMKQIQTVDEVEGGGIPVRSNMRVFLGGAMLDAHYGPELRALEQLMGPDVLPRFNDCQG